MATSRREKELARLRAERQAARRAAEAAKRRQRNSIIASTLAVAAVVSAAAYLATRGDDTPEQTAAAPADPAASQAPAGRCTYAAAGEPSRPVLPPPPNPTVSGELTATMKTDRGTVAFTLDADGAPCASQSFVTLAEQDYFDDTPCHRLTEGGLSVLQCGDPTGTGTGGPGYQFAEENLEGAQYPRGTVAMANSGPATNGSQFFLVYGDSALPPEYTVVGKITKGLRVLDKIAEGGVGEADAAGNTPPKTKVQIEDLTTAPA